MKHHFLLLTLIFCNQFAFAQLSGKITDKKSGEPVAFATISCKTENGFTCMSNKDGIFSIPDSALHVCKNWEISCVGYETISNHQLRNNETLFLVPKIIEIKPVSIGTKKKYFEVGLTKKADCSYGFNPNYLSIMYASYLPNLQGKYGIISSLAFFVGDVHKPDFNVPVRIRFFEFDTKTNLPGKEISNSNLIVYPYKKKWNTVKIDTLQQEFPTEGIVVAYELINAGVEHTHSHTYTLKGTKEKRTEYYYGWYLSVSCCDDCSNKGFSFIKNKWNNSEFYNKWAPLTKLKIMYYNKE